MGTKNSGLFFNLATLPEAIASAEQVLDKNARGSSGAHQCVVGQHGKRIGIRGMLFALQILHRYGTDEIISSNQFSFRSSGDETLTYLIEKLEFEREIAGSIVEKLKALLTPSGARHLGWYNEKHRVANEEKWFKLFAVKTCLFLGSMEREQISHAVLDQHLDRAGKVFRKLREDAPETIEAAFLTIKSLAPEGAQFRPPVEAHPRNRDKGKHVIPRELLDYILPDGRFRSKRNPSSTKQLADEIADLLQQRSRERVGLLSGEANSGKSGVLVELLRALENSSDQTDTIGLPRVGSAQGLPVFVLNVRRCTYLETLTKVHAFLASQRSSRKHYSEILDQLEIENGKRERTKRTKFHWEEIERLHLENPAFFIFTDWDEAGNESARSMLRDLPKATLVRMLHDTNRNSRILLTSVEKSTSPQVFLSQFPQTCRFRLPNPAFRQIVRYFEGLEYPQAHQKLLREQAERLGDRTLPGTHLLLVAICLQLIDLLETREQSRWLPIVYKNIEDYCSAACEQIDHSEGGYSAEAGNQPRVSNLIHILIAMLNKQDLLQAILAIAASDDGLRTSSLTFVLERWREWEPSLPSIADIETTLRGIGEIAEGFLLSKVRTAFPNKAQFGLAERIEDEQWELNQTLRQLVLEELFICTGEASWATEYVETARHAHRQVAEIARKRASNWRRFSEYSNLTRNWNDLLPDIQSYEALLASLDPTKLEDADHCNHKLENAPNLRHFEEDVFGRSDRFSDCLAFRFALFCILANEIDRDHRMAMTYDQDGIRTRLYLLPFVGVGRRYFGQLRNIRYENLPEGIDTHLRNTLDDLEIIQLLEAISLSAFHSQCPEIVRWAHDRFDDIVQAYEKGDAQYRKLYDRGVRIVCSSIDMSIQMGRPLRTDSGSHSDTMEWIKAILKDEYVHLEDRFNTDSPSEFLRGCSVGITTEKAYLRIKTREAELLALTGERRLSISVYRKINAIDNHVARKMHSAEPVILSGRPARALMLTLLRSYEFGMDKQTEPNLEELDRWIRQLLYVNTARLNRYGGAEQAAVVIGMAQYDYVMTDGDLEESQRLANFAREAIEQGNMSLGMRLQTIRICTAINLKYLERVKGRLSQKQLRSIDQAKRDAELIRRGAEALSFGPTIATAQYLKAQCALLQLKNNVSGVDPVEALKEIREAIKAMEEYHDHSFREDMQTVENKLASVC